MIFQSRVMALFFNTLTAWVSLVLFFYLCAYIKVNRITSTLWCHRNTPSIFFFKSNWQMTLTLANILTQYRNAYSYHPKDRAKLFVSVLHIRKYMAFIDIDRICLPNGHSLKSSDCNSLKTVYRNLIFVNAISIVYEISGITVKW